MAISEGPCPSDDRSDGGNEKTEIAAPEHDEDLATLTRLTEGHGDGKMTKEAILAYLVCNFVHNDPCTLSIFSGEALD